MGIMFLTLVSAVEQTNFTEGDMGKFNLVTIQLIMSFVVVGVPLVLILGLSYFFLRGGSFFVNPITLIFIVCLATLIWIIIMPSLISVVLEAIWG